MNTNYRELIGTPKLNDMLNIKSQKDDLNVRQKRAVKNIKHCANYQWGYVNSWYDSQSAGAREFMMDPKGLFDRIYQDSLINVYDDGSCYFGSQAESMLKDIKFCGKAFLQKVTLYFVAKLLEESVIEVEGTDEDKIRVGQELMELKHSIAE